jgi:hypothetical protein
MLDNSRITGSVDTILMAKTHVFGIGVGGACGIYENLVRSGLGHLTVMDFDVVDRSNISTQGFNISELGNKKIIALKNRLLDINPNLDIQVIDEDFLSCDDQIIENQIYDTTLLMFMTDNFHAQAKGNLLSLNHRKSAIFAMMYFKARASEIFFQIPGVTPACYRCATSPRFSAYLKEGYVNDVTSAGSTIFHTYYLNSVIGQIALAMIHNETKGVEFSNWFGNYWDRNYVQIRNHPAYSMEKNQLFRKTFEQEPKVYNFDSVWQKITPDTKETAGFNCPDCGGQALKSS